MAVNFNSAFYAATVEELLSRIATRTFGVSPPVSLHAFIALQSEAAHLYSCKL